MQQQDIANNTKILQKRHSRDILKLKSNGKEIPPKKRRFDMSLTRKMLKGMNLTEEQVDSIIEEHSSVVGALKEERDKYKEDAEKYSETKKALDDANKKLEDDNLQEEYDKLKSEYEDYKKQIQESQTKSAKEEARNKILKDAGIPESWMERAKKSIDLSDLKLDKDGNLKDSDKHLETIKSEWSDVIGKVKEQGADTKTPPTNAGGKSTMTREEIRKIQNPIDRQKAMLENADLFGIRK